MTKMKLLGWCAVCCALAMSPALAQNYPTKPVRMVVAFPAGGGGEFVARWLADRLTRAWSNPVMVENVSGAAGNVAAALVSKAKADGHVLLVASHPMLTANPWLYKGLPFDAEKDFAPVVQMDTVPHLLLVHPSLPVSNLSQVLALAKRRPGALAFGGGAAGTSTHLAVELLKSATNVNVTYVPYRGAAPAAIALMSGEVQVLFDSASTAIGHIQSKRVRAIAVASNSRLAAVPDLPTFAMSGLRNFTSAVSHGILAPSGTPADVIAMLNREISRQLGDEDYRKRMGQLGVELVGGTSEAFRDYLSAERSKWGRIIKEQNIKTD